MIDADAAIDAWQAEAAVPMSIPEGGWPWGAPAAEISRGPAAARIGRYAADSGLFLFHYEHAAHRELPDDWVPFDRPDLADRPTWEAGVLAERKYQGFRHDQAIGGFHPGQRAKWTAHELCHGLVGCAWRPDASPFFHATAGRLAELLPVTLWYFFDEAYVARCEAHQGAPALFRAHCAACERVARPLPTDADATARIRDGVQFFERELAAIARTRRLGRPVANGWASIDLCSDGLAYAGAHGPRLASETFRRYAAAFLVPGGGMVDDLDALEARVVAIATALCGGPPPDWWAPTRAHGAARWRLQDIGWRLCTVAHDTSGEAADALWATIDRLAGAIAATRAEGGSPEVVADAAIEVAIAAYDAVHDEWDLPPAEEAFACGFPLPGSRGTARSVLAAGIASALPLTCAVLDDLPGEVAAFAEADLALPSRARLGERFARALADRGPLADLARYEAAIASCAVGDEVAGALGDDPHTDRVRLAAGTTVHRFSVDVVAFAEAIEAESDAIEVEDVPCALVIGRSGPDLCVLDVSPATAAALDALGDGAPWGGDPGDGRSLRQIGVLVPAAWEETR